MRNTKSGKRITSHRSFILPKKSA